jgi:hypothetical protein
VADPVDIDIPLAERILGKIRRTKTDADELVAGHGGVDRAAGPLTVLYAQALDDIGGWCLDANGERQVNDRANTAFPECPECGASPGQAHDPTCTLP